MPQYNLARPIENADPNEERVFRYLSQLPDDWKIVWGYYYEDDGGNSREGDFLVLNPNGSLLIIEVKGGERLHVNKNGRWTGDYDSPFHQLDSQYGAIKKALSEGADKRPYLKIGRALAVPNIRRKNVLDLPLASQYGALILTQEDLSDAGSLIEAWKRPFSHANPNSKSCHRFTDSPWGKGFTPDAGKILSNWLDIEIERFRRTQFTVLDYLPYYQRFAITGGPGSGKTWLCLELALRFAGRDEGPTDDRKILLLCYNRPLADFLKKVLKRMAGSKAASKKLYGRIDVQCWEDLVSGALLDIGVASEKPTDPDGLTSYFRKDVPAGLNLALEDGSVRPLYHAMVVDEAQDHNTNEPELPEGGWWRFYSALLHDPESAPIAVALDSAQRQQFRRENVFSEETLMDWLGNDVVRVHCPAPLRYTREIARYLKELCASYASLSCFGSQFTDAGLKRLSEGFPIENRSADKTEIASEAEKLAASWIEAGYATPDEILIIGASSKKESHGLCDTLAGFRLEPIESRGNGEIGYVSSARCKGLDARGVIVVGFRPLKDLEESWIQSFFLAASRARQLLAIVEQQPTTPRQ